MGVVLKRFQTRSLHDGNSLLVLERTLSFMI